MTEPLVPVEVDLTSFAFMPLEVHRLLTSTTWIEAAENPKVAHAAMSLWCQSWHQRPAASLPDNDAVLAHLAMCDAKTWKSIRIKVLAGFVKCSDGRWYHPVVAANALEAWERQQEFQETSTNRDTRQQRWRLKIKELSAKLREAGITPPMNPSKAELERLIATHVDKRVDDSGDGMASTGASTTTSTADKSEIAKTGTGTGTGRETNVSLDIPPTPEGLTCRLLREAGLDPVNPSHPTLQRLLAAGCTPQQFVDLYAEQKRSGKTSNFKYLLGTIEGRMADAAASPKLAVVANDEWMRGMK